MSSLELKNGCSADMLMQHHPFVKYYVMVYDVAEII